MCDAPNRVSKAGEAVKLLADKQHGTHTSRRISCLYNSPPQAAAVCQHKGECRLHQFQVVGEEARQAKVNQTDFGLQRREEGEGGKGQMGAQVNKLWRRTKARQ